MPLPPKTYQFLVGVFASLGSFNYGYVPSYHEIARTDMYRYDLGVIGGAIASTSFVSAFNPNPNET